MAPVSAIETTVRDIRADLAEGRAADVPSLRVVRRRWSRLLRDRPARDILAIASRLARGRSFGEQMIACELLRHHTAAFDALSETYVERLADGVAGWGLVDMFGVTVAGPAWRAGAVSDAAVRAWGRSPDRWRRRLALVATVALNSRARGGSGDPARTLAICAVLADDRDDMVVKAMSWALRELAKRDPQAVRAFLRRERARLAPRILREVRNKLEFGLKNP